MLTKIMLWLRDHLDQAIRQDNRNHSNFILDKPSYRRKINLEGINFTVYRGADGGTVVETSVYDRKNDNTVFHLYVIHEDQNLGAELERIITLELLKSPN